jgi:hypothetical protein
MAATALPHVDVSLCEAGHRSPIRATPATLCRIVLWSFLVLLVTTTSADPDLWGHLRFGLDLLASKSIVVADPYSFTADRAWINHEWLAELLMGMGFAGFGALGLNLLKLAFIAVVGAIALVIAKQEQASPIARDLYAALILFAAVLGRDFLRGALPPARDRPRPTASHLVRTAALRGLGQSSRRLDCGVCRPRRMDARRRVPAP